MGGRRAYVTEVSAYPHEPPRALSICILLFTVYRILYSSSALPMPNEPTAAATDGEEGQSLSVQSRCALTFLCGAGPTAPAGQQGRYPPIGLVVVFRRGPLSYPLSIEFEWSSVPHNLSSFYRAAPIQRSEKLARTLDKYLLQYDCRLLFLLDPARRLCRVITITNPRSVEGQSLTLICILRLN